MFDQQQMSPVSAIRPRIARWGLLALACVVFSLAPRPAQASGFALWGSYYSPDDADETFGLGVRYTWDFRGNNWGIDLTSAWYDAAEARLEVSEGIFVDDEILVVPLDLGFRYTVNRSGPQPYLGAGGSFVRLRSDLGETDDEAGWYALAGVQFGDRRGPKLVIEGNYRDISEASVKLFPNQAEADQPSLSLSGIAINVGLAWGL